MSAAERYESEWFDAFQRVFSHVPHILYDEDQKPAEKAIEAMLALFSEIEAERDTALRALENLSEDAAQLEAEDLRLHDLESRLGAMLLGFGGGHNHLDDIRAVLAAAGEPRK